MSLTTSQALSQFSASLGPTDSQASDIQSRVAVAKDLLQAAFPPSSDLPLAGMTIIGSASRGTIVRPINDIDVMARFDNKDNVFEKYRNDSVSFLARVREALNAKAKVQQVGSRGQAVRLFYKQGAHVDIAPVFTWSGGGYALPAGDRTWMTTDPNAQAAWFEERRVVLGSNLLPLIRLAKRWNDEHSRRLGSFHVEVMVASMFRSLGPDQLDNLRLFFEWAPNQLSLADPAGHSGPLDASMPALVRSALVSRLGEAKKRAEQAMAAEGRGDHAEAKRIWRIELGDGFPVG